MGMHDTELDRDGILLIALVGVLAVTVVIAFIGAGPEWLAGLGIAVSILSVVALLWMFGRLVGPGDDEH